LPNTTTTTTTDGALEGVLLGQQTFDAALTSSEITISIKLNVACWHCDGRTLWRSSTAFDLVA
jgi:hypothetical protein